MVVRTRVLVKARQNGPVPALLYGPRALEKKKRLPLGSHQLFFDTQIP